MDIKPKEIFSIKKLELQDLIKQFYNNALLMRFANQPEKCLFISYDMMGG